MKPTLPFTKMHGTGNDFVVLDALRKPLRLSADTARRLCDRRFGVGADQILLLEPSRRSARTGSGRGRKSPSRRADLRMRIVNADGSEVEMCGNGIRCVARYVHDRGFVKKREMAVETLAGIIRPSLKGDGQVRVDMGPPVLDAAKIPTRAKGRVIDQLFKWKGRSVRMTCVSMGNPHAVIFVDDLDKTPVEVWGPEIENHPFFPRRVNVEFVQVTDGRHARVRVWERGAGLTLACGTGACAVGVAGALTGRLQRHSFLELPGGTLEVEWAADGRVYLTGPAAFVYDGEFRMEKNHV